jgi:hypothetical protein
MYLGIVKEIRKLVIGLNDYFSKEEIIYFKI